MLKGLRVDRETEQIGMDMAKHGGAAYEINRRRSVLDNFSFSRGKDSEKEQRRVDSGRSGEVTIIENGEAIEETRPVAVE